MRKTTIITGLFVLSILLLSTASQPTFAKTNTVKHKKNPLQDLPYGGEIKLGATVSLTGKYSTEGQRLLNGYLMAVKDINDNGGVVVGGKRYNFTLIYYDDGSDKTQAAQLYSKLIDQDHVDLLLGPYSSSIVLSVAPVAEEKGIPMIQAGGASDSIYQQGFTYIFGLYRVASTYTQPLFKWLNDSGHINDVSTVAVFLELSAFPESVFKGAKKYIENAGLSLVGVYNHTSGQLTDIPSQVDTLRASGGADIILAIGHYADSKAVVDAIYTKGLRPKIIYGTVGVPEPKFVEELGDKAEYVMGFAQWVTNLPESQAPGITDFVTRYNQTYGEMPAYHAAGAYAAVQVAKAAIEAAGTFTNHTAVRDALKALDIKTIWGEVKFTETGVIGGTGYMVQIINGNIETVFPVAYQTHEPVFPIPWEEGGAVSIDPVLVGGVIGLLIIIAVVVVVFRRRSA